MLQRRFQLHRKADPTGVSGTGIVAEGCLFSNNECVVKWLSKRSSTTLYNNISDVEAIHGHEGNTQIVWLDDEPKTVTKETVVVTKTKDEDEAEEAEATETPSPE